MSRVAVRAAECEECGRGIPRDSRLCRKCLCGRDAVQQLEEAAWKGEAWSVFTRIETANVEA